MTIPPKERWVPCSTPVVSNIIRWREPLWAKPNKPRGKPDKVGEQAVTAKVMMIGEMDLVELQVIAVKQLSLAEAAVSGGKDIQKDDLIRRKLASIKKGECQKLLEE